ncbi:DUF427 domain-containing protein [Spongiimicrobium salis]|uniref:DUF427 domain-containing protein n=1 Tax=Spongiimicrobium salis TaxID=1667022 RepID=UPI00374CE51A
MKQHKKQEEIAYWLQQAREKWEYRGQKRPSFAEIPKKGQRSVWDFPRPPKVEKVQQPLQVMHEDTIIADSSNALAVLETASPPTYYIPMQDIQMDLLVPIPKKTSLCEWKGSAHYWALKAQADFPIGWSYPKLFEGFHELKEHLAFYPQYLDCRVGGIRVIPQPGRFYAGWITPDLRGPFKGEKGSEHW